jgi:hypothetical protein
MAAGVIYLIAIGSGVFKGVPLLTYISIGGPLLLGLLAVLLESQPWWAQRQAARLLRKEPNRVTTSLSKLPGVPSDTSSEDLAEAIKRLPEPERTILVLRIAGPMTLADLGERLRMSGDRVREYEAQAIARLAKELQRE